MTSIFLQYLKCAMILRSYAHAYILSNLDTRYFNLVYFMMLQCSILGHLAIQEIVWFLKFRDCYVHDQNCLKGGYITEVNKPSCKLLK